MIKRIKLVARIAATVTIVALGITLFTYSVSRAPQSPSLASFDELFRMFFGMVGGAATMVAGVYWLLEGTGKQ